MTLATAGARTGSGVARRLVGVDAARGVALLGMVAVHTLPSRGDDGGSTLAHEIAGGRSAATFAVLAGVGLALATGRATPPRGGRRARMSVAIALRALLIAVIGLALGELESGIAVILTYYGVLFLLALPVLAWPPRRLLVTAAVLALVVPLLSWLVRDGLAPQSGAVPSFTQLSEDPGELVRQLLLTGYYPALAWTAYLLAGLGLGRLALGSTRVAATLLAAGAGLAVAAHAVSALLLGPLGGLDALRPVVEPRAGQSVAEAVAASRFGTVPTDSAWWLATDAPHSTTPLDLLATGGVALAVLGLALLVAGRAPAVLLPLAAVGAMPLTLYCLHVAAIATFEPESATRFYLLQLALAVVAALLWRRFVGRGPLEALLALLTARVVGSRT